MERFSISPSWLDTAINYMINQKEHHKTQTFKKEVDELMIAHGIFEFSEEFFWI